MKYLKKFKEILMESVINNDLKNLSRDELESLVIELRKKINQFESELEESSNKPITKEGFQKMVNSLADYFCLSYGEIKEKLVFEEHDEDEDYELVDEVIDCWDESNIEMIADDISDLPTDDFMSQSRKDKLLKELADDILQNFEDYFDNHNFPSAQGRSANALENVGVVVGEIYE